MTPLRQRMLEDLTRDNYAPRTRQTYVAQIARLARHFGTSPDQLTRDEVQQYQDLLASQGVSWLPQANRVVIEPSPHDRCQPACRFAHGTMHALVQRSFNRNERRSMPKP